MGKGVAACTTKRAHMCKVQREKQPDVLLLDQLLCRTAQPQPLRTAFFITATQNHRRPHAKFVCRRLIQLAHRCDEI